MKSRVYVNKFKATFGLKREIKWVTAHDQNPQRRLLKGYRELHCLSRNSLGYLGR